MAILNTISCITGEQFSINFNGYSPSIGEIWSALKDDNYVCVEITSLLDEPLSSYLAQTQYVTCDECLRTNYCVVQIINCLNDSLYQVTYSSFVSEPIIGDVFNGTVSFIGESPFTITSCFSIENFKMVTENEYNISISGSFLGFVDDIYSVYKECIDCLPRSAGTESFICVICNDIVSGETVTSVSPPHPVWTDSKGTAVTQLNAIALGGMNGLNN